MLHVCISAMLTQFRIHRHRTPQQKGALQRSTLTSTSITHAHVLIYCYDGSKQYTGSPIVTVDRNHRILTRIDRSQSIDALVHQEASAGACYA